MAGGGGSGAAGGVGSVLLPPVLALALALVLARARVLLRPLPQVLLPLIRLRYQQEVRHRLFVGARVL